MNGTPGSEQDTIFEIGDWRAEPALLRLCRGAEAHRLEPKVMALLVFLAERAPKVVSRAEIFEQIWAGRAVVDETLTRCVSLLRQALGDDAQAPRYIETIPRKGYRLVAAVQRRREALPPPAPGRVTPAVRRRTAWARQQPWLLALLLVAISALIVLAVNRPAVAPGAAPARPRLAVLPFHNLTGNPSDAYLADGLTEELIHQLASLSGLKVVSRTSSMHVQGSAAQAADIAKRLRADYLLEGSVLAVDERIRITAQLIRPDRDEHLWSQAYDRALADILTLQRDVARDVATQVQAELTPPEQARLEPAPAVDTAAYRLYLEGRQRLNRRVAADLRVALERFQEALEHDPDFAAAWAALAEAHLLSDPYLSVPQTQAYGQAQAAIDRALALDPGLAAAHASLGLLRLFRDWDWRASEAAYRRALQREPSYALAHQWFSEMLSLAGRHEEALAEIHIAVDLDPLSPLVHAAWGQRLNAAGRHREALARLGEAETLGASFRWHLREVAYAHQRLGNEGEAIQARIEQMRRLGTNAEDMAALIAATETEGLQGFWRWHLQHLLEPLAAEPILIAEAYAALGATDEDLPWLQTAVAKRGGWFLHLAKSPAFDGLRDEPRFQELMEQVGPGR